jgi:hypothetical protein
MGDTNYFARGIQRVFLTPFELGFNAAGVCLGAVTRVLLFVLTTVFAVLWGICLLPLFLVLAFILGIYAGVCFLGDDREAGRKFSSRMERVLRTYHPWMWTWLTEVFWALDPHEIEASRDLGTRAVAYISGMFLCIGLLFAAGNVIYVRCDVSEKTNMELARLRAQDLFQEEQAKLREQLQRNQAFEREHPVLTGVAKTLRYLQDHL